LHSCRKIIGVVWQSVLVGSSFTFIYAISVNNGVIDRIPTTSIPAINENTLGKPRFLVAHRVVTGRR